MKNSDRSAHIVSFSTANTPLYNATLDKEQNYIGKRIAEARGALKLSLVSLRDLLETYGVSVTDVAISKWEHGKSMPNAYQLLAISQALQMPVDFSHLMSNAPRPELNEEGLRKVADYRADLIASGRYKPQPKVLDLIKYIEKPVSNLAVSAGNGQFLDEGNFEMISFPENSVPENADFGIRISGNSMEPVYHDGQIVWVQKTERVSIGEVGIFVYDGEGYIKMYSEQEPEDSCRDDFIDSYGTLHMQPVLISYNQDYAPKVVSGSASFQVVGRVL